VDTIPSPTTGPDTPPSVNVTVTVAHGDLTRPRIGPRVLGYTVTGLLMIGFIVGQLVVGGIITFTLP
jgi:hypothetical protein